MEKFLENFKVKTKEAPQPWQLGIKTAINSLRDLYTDTIGNEEYNFDGHFSFMMTSRLNQDCLENLFSRVRAIGGDNCHPGPFEFMRRMRVLQLGQGEKIKIWTNNPAVMMETDNESADETGMYISRFYIMYRLDILDLFNSTSGSSKRALYNLTYRICSKISRTYFKL